MWRLLASLPVTFSSQAVRGRWDGQLEDGGGLGHGGGGSGGLGLGADKERGLTLAGTASFSVATGFSFCSATCVTAERAVCGRVLLGNVRANRGECLLALAGVTFLHQHCARQCS